ncbi:MAG TPA: MBL fold metallo-hydrolase [Polyangiales bacterium]|nr:MBL fold metallo-hydrolase [Polyangiales bacterium]
MSRSDSYAAQLSVGPYSVRGVSVAGVYTTLQVPELGVLLDVGLPLRAYCATDRLFLSHGHVDHSGGLLGLLGVRGMMNKPEPLKLYLPAEIADDMRAMLEAASRMQRFAFDVELVPMKPGDELLVANTLWVRAFRTHHPVPSLGFQFFRRVNKLKAEYVGLPGPEIARRKREGEPLFTREDQLELCYATDTLVRVLDTNPSMLESRVLILECTFYDERKSLADARAGCHIHLDELIPIVERFRNPHIVLMHTSQIYSPTEAREILLRRCPPSFTDRVQQLLPTRGNWL